MGCDYHGYYISRLRRHFKKLIEREIEEFYHSYSMSRDHEYGEDIMTYQIDNFKFEYVYEQSRCSNEILERYNGQKLDKNKWRISEWIELTKDDVINLDSFVDCLLVSMNRHIDMLRNSVDISELLSINEKFVRAVNIVRNNPLYLSLFE